MSALSFLPSLVLALVLLLSSSPLLTSSLPTPPPLQSGDTATLSSLLAYWVRADNDYAAKKINASQLLAASTTLFTYMSSPTVDSIAAANVTAPILNFRSLYSFWAPHKKYVVAQGFTMWNRTEFETPDFVEFLAAAVNDYSTLDQVTVLAVLTSMQQDVLSESSNRSLWITADAVGSDSSLLESATFVLQQCYHATSLAQNNLSDASIPMKALPLISTPITTDPFPAATGVSADVLFTATDAALRLELAHLVDGSHYIGVAGGFGKSYLPYNRSLSAAFARLQPNATDSLSIVTTYGFNATVSFGSQAFSASTSPNLYVQMAQLDGWGDRLSFDIFPTVLVAIASTEPPPAVDESYPANSVSLTFGYDQRNCDDGWANSGKFRFSLGAEQADCQQLTCAKYLPDSQTFSTAKTDVISHTWNKAANTFECLLSSPGYYTVIKANPPIMLPNTSRTDQIVTARLTLTTLPAELQNDTARMMELAAQDLTFLLDVPPARIQVTGVSPSADGSAGDRDVQFKIFGGFNTSVTPAATLFAAFVKLNIDNTSHTDLFRSMAIGKSQCESGCSPAGGGSKFSETEIIAIAVVVGFFGTIILGVLLTLCCCQMKYWWDRHDFRPAQVDEEDETELGIGASSAYGGVQSARERQDDSKRRRSTRVSWYNKQDVETAASYSYKGNSRNSRSNSASESGKAPVFRVRSDSRGSVEDGLQLDEVEVVGGAEDVSLDDLAEIGIVMDGVDGTAADEDSYVMDGHKVKAVKQMKEVDAEDVDDSKFSRSRSASQLTEYSANSDAGQEDSVNSRNSRNSVSEVGANPDDDATPRTPRTPGGGKRAFYYNSGQ